MSDFFDELVGPAEDFNEANATAAGGALVVPQRSPSGAFLNVEEEADRATGSIGRLVVFVECDEGTGELIFSNAGEFAGAMGTVSLPSEEQALDWLSKRLSEGTKPWLPRLAAAWEEAEANAPAVARPKPEDAPRIWARAPHTTGRNRGQNR
ncbi:hypothetical protein ABIB00_002153 [Bradyrhizobium sp. LB14.3]|uniref:hypothetical protein n=1 Tax=Bradyrhizobium sp. LB14.3 TaxID=3156328 RepID=UPI0033910955